MHIVQFSSEKFLSNLISDTHSAHTQPISQIAFSVVVVDVFFFFSLYASSEEEEGRAYSKCCTRPFLTQLRTHG